MAFGEVLGCAQTYTVTIHWRGGERVYTYVDKVQSVEWNRDRRRVSTATVVVSASGVSSGCMERLLTTYEGVHEMTVYRDEAVVWQGPITNRRVTVSGNQPIRIEFTAADVLEYVRRRLLARTVRLTSEDLAEVAAEVVRSTLTTRDPNVVDHLVVEPVGETANRTLSAYSRYGLDELAEVGALGVDWTALGRTIYLTPPATASTPPQAAITGEHLVGEIDIVSTLDDYASRVFAAPQAQNNVWNHLEGAGGYSPIWGMWDHVVQTSLAYNLDEAGNWEPSGTDGLSQAQTELELRRTAQARLEIMSRPPLTVRPGDGSHLAPSTPVDLRRLVPGVRIDMAVGLIAPLAVQAAMRLTRVTGSWSADGEQIRVSLVQLGSPADTDDLEGP